jgi:hypothetical protein
MSSNHEYTIFYLGGTIKVILRKKKKISYAESSSETNSLDDYVEESKKVSG